MELAAVDTDQACRATDRSGSSRLVAVGVEVAHDLAVLHADLQRVRAFAPRGHVVDDERRPSCVMLLVRADHRCTTMVAKSREGPSEAAHDSSLRRRRSAGSSSTKSLVNAAVPLVAVQVPPSTCGSAAWPLMVRSAVEPVDPRVLRVGVTSRWQSAAAVSKRTWPARAGARCSRRHVVV